jgi:uncharacterized protein YndB with AHSA1/START domain
MVLTNQFVEIQQVFCVPSGEVFNAFTSGTAWCRWCCDEAQVDPRLGGQLAIHTPSYWVNGVFTAWEQNKHLAFTWHGTGEPPTQVEITLDDRDGATQMVFRVTNLGDEQAWSETAHVFQSAWGRALAHLKSVLEGTTS